VFQHGMPGCGCTCFIS